MTDLVWIASGRKPWGMRLAFRRASPDLKHELEVLLTRFPDAAAICDRLARFIGDRIHVAGSRPQPVLHRAWHAAVMAPRAIHQAAFAIQFAAGIDAMLTRMAQDLSGWELRTGETRWDPLGETAYLDWEITLPTHSMPECARKSEPAPESWIRARLEAVALDHSQRAKLRRYATTYA